ncbi:MAG: hypothetical protein HND52_18805 [Ignavibacteriae bacterium]|nr:hypothetical protein [Ignavibacteriota bacterium]NOH00016.1 hypothetical protein [Ignavibacteriota bacterium]
MKKTKQVKTINSSFTKSWNVSESHWMLNCNGVELTKIGNHYVLSRDLGYTIPIAELKTSNYEFVSAEVVPGSNGNQMLLRHDNYYFLTKALSDTKSRVRLKYFDPPDVAAGIIDIDYMTAAKEYILNCPTLKIVAHPYGKNNYDMHLMPDGFRMRPASPLTFYFETKIVANTYGEIYLAVDQIIHKMERTVIQQLKNLNGTKQP